MLLRRRLCKYTYQVYLVSTVPYVPGIGIGVEAGADPLAIDFHERRTHGCSQRKETRHHCTVLFMFTLEPRIRVFTVNVR